MSINLHEVLEGTARAQQHIYRSALSNHPAAKRLEAIVRQYQRDCDTQKDDMDAGKPMKVSTALSLLIEAAKL